MSDDDAAQVDVAAMLAEGLDDGTGELRGELVGEGALAAAVQLERDGVPVDAVALALTQVRSRDMGIDLDPGDLPPRLAGWLAASPGDKQLAEWLGLVANLMMLRGRYA